MSECVTELPVVELVFNWPDNPTPFVLGPTCPDGDEGGFWWNQLAQPEFGMRLTYAPPSVYVPGNALLGAVPDSGVLAAQIAVQAPDRSTLVTYKNAVEVALTQFGLIVSIVVDGVPDAVWDAFPSLPIWRDNLTPRGASMLTVEGTLVVPVNPVSAP